MSGPWPTVLMDFLKQLGREMQNGDPKGRVASLALGVVFRKTKDHLHKALIVASSSITGMAASLAFGVEPLGVMDSLRAATYAQDQDQQLVVVCMGLSFVSAVELVVRLLRPVACMDIVLLRR